MRPFLRPTVVLLTALSAAACGHWVGRYERPRDVLSDPDVRHVRLTRTNTQRIEMRIAEIRNDSIYGTVGGSGPLSCVEAGPDCNARLPLSEVGFVEVRSFSAIRTASIVIVPIGVLAVALIASDTCHQGPVDTC